MKKLTLIVAALLAIPALPACAAFEGEIILRLDGEPVTEGGHYRITLEMENLAGDPVTPDNVHVWVRPRPKRSVVLQELDFAPASSTVAFVLTPDGTSIYDDDSDVEQHEVLVRIRVGDKYLPKLYVVPVKNVRGFTVQSGVLSPEPTPVP